MVNQQPEEVSGKTIFKKGRQLYLNKWSHNKQVTNCLKDFFAYWGKEDTENWYGGYHPDGCVPSTDNALESTNRQVKEKGTFRQRLPCGQFVNIFAIMLNQKLN